MPIYSQDLKEQMVRKMMPPGHQSVANISRETGICAPTLYAWKKEFRTRGFVVPSKSTQPDRWDSKTKLAALIQTTLMNEAERSTYCREHGLYVEQLDAWKQAFESSDVSAGSVDRAELMRERKKSAQLTKELQRKEKALAEAAALLILSKKAQAIWGTVADD